MQHRLSRAEIEQLTHHYREGASIDALTRRYDVHRTTVIHHLDQAGVSRRRVVRKMNDESVALAAARYEQGASLEVVAKRVRGAPTNPGPRASPSRSIHPTTTWLDLISRPPQPETTWPGTDEGRPVRTAHSPCTWWQRRSRTVMLV